VDGFAKLQAALFNAASADQSELALKDAQMARQLWKIPDCRTAWLSPTS